MSTETTTLTSKFQATIPRNARVALDVKPGEAVTWHIVRGMVVVDAHKKVKHPAKFLTSQRRLPFDAVKLVRKVRNEIA